VSRSQTAFSRWLITLAVTVIWGFHLVVIKVRKQRSTFWASPGNGCSAAPNLSAPSGAVRVVICLARRNVHETGEKQPA
jgi:hypothetical protein